MLYKMYTLNFSFKFKMTLKLELPEFSITAFGIISHVAIFISVFFWCFLLVSSLILSVINLGKGMDFLHILLHFLYCILKMTLF